MLRDAISLTRLLAYVGYRVAVTPDGPRLVKAVPDAVMPPGVMAQVRRLRADLLRLHGPTCPKDGCGADVSDGVALAEANGVGVCCGCPLGGCPYRG